MSFTIDPYYSGSYSVTTITNPYGGTLCGIYDYANTNRMFRGTSTGFDAITFTRNSTTKKINGISQDGYISNYIRTPKGEYPYYGIAYLNDFTLIYTDLQGYICQIKPGGTEIGKRDKDIYIKRSLSDLPMSYFSDNDAGKIIASVGSDVVAANTVDFFVGEYTNSFKYAPYKDIILSYTGASSSGVERGSRGMVKVPSGSSLFPNNTFLLIENGFKIYSYEYDSNFKPVVSSKKLFGSVPIVGKLPPKLSGGFIDPVTNDFIFFWQGNIYIVSGFSVPTGGENLVPSTNCYSSGDNTHGSFGLLNNITPFYYFTNIGRDKTIFDAKAGQNFSVFLQQDGKLFASGLNNEGQLGNPSVSLSLKFIQMGVDTDWTQIAVGSDHVVALKSNGDMYGCGSNRLGQLGQPVATTNLTSLTKLNTNQWNKISSFHNFTFGIATNGTLWSTGDNSKGQLGRGTTVGSFLFRQVGTDTDWVDVSCGYDFTYAIKADGSMYAVGNNEYGQMGIGNTINQLVFIRTGINKSGSYDVKFRKVSAGTIHGIALTNDNTMYGVGYNLYGELGLGDTISRNYWTKIGTDIWSDVAAGSAYTLAIKSDTTLWGAGYNYNGTLGLGPGTSPTKDSKYLNFTQILLQSTISQPAWLKVQGSYDQSIAITSFSLTTTTTTTSTTSTTTTSTTTTTIAPGSTTTTTSTTSTTTTSTSPVPSIAFYGGYFVAGSTNNTGVFSGTKTTYKLNYYYEVNYRSAVSDISYNADRLFGLSNLTTTGYIAGGYTTDSLTNSYSSSITKINYATDVASLDKAVLMTGRYYGASLSDADSSKGYISGGYVADSAVNSTEIFDFSTNVVSSNTLSNLSSQRAIMASFTDNSAKGFYLGGISGNLNQNNYGVVAVVDRVLFATNTCSVSSAILSESKFGGVGLFSTIGYGYYCGGYSSALSQVVNRFNLIIEASESLNTASINLISLDSASVSLTFIKGFVTGGKLNIKDSTVNSTINTTYRMGFAIPESFAIASSSTLPEAKWGLASASYSSDAKC